MNPPKKKITNLRIKQQALYVMIFSFVTVIVWITASLFRSQRRTGIAPDLQELAKPLSPTINVDVIDRIEQSESYSDQDLLQFQIYKLIRSKDGRNQQIVPIDSQLDQIPEEEFQVVVEENPPENQESLLDEEEGNAVQEVILPPAGTAGFGSDGRYYLD